MHRSLLVIYLAITLDAVGVGLVFPILPALLQDVAGADSVAPLMGVMAALYAAMQFVFAPVLGALSDRLGRRPVLLISIAGAVVNYLILAYASSFWLLLLGRAMAGLTSANTSVAYAYITDISAEAQRARRFGLLNAMFGAGFIFGPVLGGVLGDIGVRLPFLAAAGLNAINLVLALCMLSETRAPGGETTRREPIRVSDLNPVRPLVWAFSTRELPLLVLIFFLLSATGEAYGVCWAMWGADAFHWSSLGIGLSLGTFGVCQTLAQAFLPGPASRQLGERGAVCVGIACASMALIAMAFIQQGWLVFVIMPLFALGGIGTPALQALATRQVDTDHQGRLQGVLASVVSLASVIAPLVFSSFYFVMRDAWPGAIWLLVMTIYAMAFPVVILSTRGSQRARV
ncbi:TCR/Tet family MFS transporter [Hahella sp. NBU794]|uniref:TCR/Tet family MFS transporter n=1 Tax=Hahella sp. NBU794 TaxID=3422590 RepID=UPI003D6FE167